MNSSDNILDIAEIIMFFVLTAAAVYLMIFLKKVIKTLFGKRPVKPSYLNEEVLFTQTG